ncbi:MAG: nuclease [Acidobacteria bacterium]|nr:nuclease [Acidobacteriota bacterium]
MKRTLLIAAWPYFLAMTCAAQQSIGTVKTNEAEVSGTVAVKGTVAEILTSGNIKAGPASAQVDLTRGGKVTVCMNSVVSLSQSSTEKSPLMLALQRGAFEVKMEAGQKDVVMTPDLHFDISNAAPLDLHVRVAPNGDTCVENRGKDAPVLHVTEQFGIAGYFVKPEQHVLFVHGSITEVVDRETSNCGCPGEPQVLAGNKFDPHPFPEAISQGLEEPKVPQEEPGVPHTEISTSISYNGREAASTPHIVAPPQWEPEKKKKHAAVTKPFRAIGHFFKRVFAPE